MYACYEYGATRGNMSLNAGYPGDSRKQGALLRNRGICRIGGLAAGASTGIQAKSSFVWLTGILFFCLVIPAIAHHSAALFYKVDERITVSGTVSEFRFGNPHAILLFTVTGEDGEAQEWTAETTSPSILRRRGWSQQSFTPGEKVTIEGMPSVDGSYLIRIVRAFREDGSEIGIPRGTDN